MSLTEDLDNHCGLVDPLPSVHAGPSFAIQATPILEHIPPNPPRRLLLLKPLHPGVTLLSASMRLIDTTTGEFAEFVDSSTAPLYAILSHTWAQPPEREQSYQEVVEIQKKFRCSSPLDGEVVADSLPPSTPSSTPQPDALTAHEASISTESTPSDPQPVPPPCRSIWDLDSGLSHKVRKACEIARGDGYRYIWVDSSCIDKTSSSELSEAINSMFNWYRDAQICYTFLADVPSDEDVRGVGPRSPTATQSRNSEGQKRSKFRKSRWFKRSWTLQELIAPRMLVFLSKDWKGLGTKESLADLVEEITHIDRDILTHKKALADESVAGRMKWAAEREATRVEDEAYSLLGIFGITMPTLYGEGRHAFQRLQEEILQRIPDRTLFAWGESRLLSQVSPTGPIRVSLPTSPFAPSPRSFRWLQGKISSLSHEDFKFLGLQAEEYTLTPHGIRAKLSFISLKDWAPALSIVTHDSDIVSKDRISADSWHLILLGSQQTCGGRGLLVYVFEKDLPQYELGVLFRLQGDPCPELKTVYLPYPIPSTTKRQPQDGLLTLPTISLSPWAQGLLPHGYTISVLHPTGQRPQESSLLTLQVSNESFDIHIQYWHLQASEPFQATAIQARIWILESPPANLPDENGAEAYTLHSSHPPPHASAIWFVLHDSPIPLTQKNIYLRDNALTLRLWLGPAAPSHCHTHVEIVPDPASPPRDSFTRT